MPEDLRTLAMGLLCPENRKRKPTTASAARDMLRVPERIDETRTRLAKIAKELHQLAHQKRTAEEPGSCAGVRLMALHVSGGRSSERPARHAPPKRALPHRHVMRMLGFVLLTIAAIILLVTTEVETTMNLSVADPPTVMSSLVMVTPVPAAEFETRKDEIEKRPIERDADQKLAYRKNIALVLLQLKQLLTESPAVATLGTPAGAGKRSYAREGDTVAVLTWAVSVQSDRYLKVTVDNQTAERIELENAWIREGKRYSEEAVFVPAPGTETTKDRIAIVPPYSQVTGMVLVPDHVKTPLDDLKVQLLGPAAVPALVAAQIVELYPMPPEERRRRRQEKQVALSMRAVGGALWLSDGANQDMVGGAPTSSLAVRVSKGMHRNLSSRLRWSGASPETFVSMV